MQKEILLFLAILDFGFACFAFTGAQFFSESYLLLLLLLPLLSAAIFIITSTDYFSSGKYRSHIAVSLAAASVALILVNASFDAPSSRAISLALFAIWLLSVASAIGIAGIFLAGRLMRFKWTKSKGLAIAAVFLALALTACAAYLFQYGLGNSWRGVDELAYNYYSSYLFLHGLNPYLISMEPALSSRGIPAPFMLNGAYDYTYYYPALSFLAYIPLAASGIRSLLPFIVVIALIAIVAAFEVYCRSGFNRLVLIPLAAWLGSSFFLSFSANAYLAVSFLLLFAYAYRDRTAVSGVLIGLAASAHQLAWFALPFFFLLTAREHGFRRMAKQIAFSLAAFIAINGYFIAVSPGATLNSLFSLFLTSRLQPAGLNMVQFLLAFYPVSYGYSAIVCASLLAATLFIFYFYGRTARTLIAVVPMFIFFLSLEEFRRVRARIRAPAAGDTLRRRQEGKEGARQDQ